MRRTLWMLLLVAAVLSRTAVLQAQPRYPEGDADRQSARALGALRTAVETSRGNTFLLGHEFYDDLLVVGSSLGPDAARRYAEQLGLVLDPGIHDRHVAYRNALRGEGDPTLYLHRQLTARNSQFVTETFRQFLAARFGLTVSSRSGLAGFARRHGYRSPPAATGDFELLTLGEPVAAWQAPFVTGGPGTFALDGGTLPVGTMESTDFVYQLGVVYHRAVAIPLRQTRFPNLAPVAVFIQPRGGATLEQALNEFSFLDVDIEGRLRRQEPKTLTRVVLPRLEGLTGSFDVGAYIRARGGSEVFGPNADLSGITDQPGRHWGTIAQRVRFSMNEGGFGDPAVTSVRATNSALPQSEFVVNGPFAVLIMEPSSFGGILFAAAIRDPRPDVWPF